METVQVEQQLAALEKENRILKKKLARSQVNREILEELLSSHTQALRVLNAEIIESRENVLSNISDGVFSVDHDWCFTYMNPSALTLFQTQDSLVGKSLWELIPEDSLFYRELYCAKEKKCPGHFEALLEPSNLLMEIHAYPKANGVLVIFRDISRKKILEAEMTRLDRLNLVGQMAAGIAHEIRNPMTTVRGFLQLFSNRNEFSAYQSRFNLMISELDRANSIIKEYLSLARNKQVNSSWQSLNHVLEMLLPLMESDALLGGKWIVSELAPTLPEVFLDAQEIRQLILNFCRNGLEAMGEGGTLTIGTRKEKDHVVLFIRDQGKGIPPEIQQKLGTPFFTTKENGTGLGLAICYSIAHRHQAKIQVITSNAGTTFNVNFPLER